MLANMTYEGAQGFLGAMGSTVDPMLVSGFVMSAKSVMEDKKLSDEEKQLSVQKLKQDLITSQTSKTQEAIQGIQTIDAQVGINGFTQANADALKASLGFAYEKDLQSLDVQIKNTENEQAKADLIEQKSNLEQLGIIYGDGEDNTLNKLQTFTQGETPITRDKDNEFLGQCSAFVNDVAGLGTGFFSSSWDSKISKSNKDVSQIPSSGDVFISSLGNSEIGHVGFVESVQINEKGETTVTIADSNRQNNEKFSRRTVTLDQLLKSEANGGEAVKGYYSPVNASRSGVNDPSKKVFEISLGEISTFNDEVSSRVMRKTKAGQAKFNQFTEKKDEIMKDKEADIEDVLRYSKGGKDVSEKGLESLEKFDSTLSNLESIAETIKGLETGPVVSKLRSANPWEIDQKFLEAQLDALIPGLARGVYGEVGVLTDQDVELYKRTVPNAKSPKELNNLILAMTARKLQNAYKSKLQTQAAGGRDVSLFGGLYDDIEGRVQALLPDAEVTQPQFTTSSGFTFTPAASSVVTTEEDGELDSIFQ